MSRLKSKLSNLFVIYFFISSIFYIDLGSCTKLPPDLTADVLLGEIMLIKNEFKISNEIGDGGYELFSPDKKISVTICKKKNQQDSPDKKRPFFLTKTEEGLFPNFYYCFPTEGTECPKGLFYFSEGNTDAYVDAFMAGKKYSPLRSQPESVDFFTATKDGKFKKVGISPKKALLFGEEYSELNVYDIHPFNFLTDKIGEINLNGALKKIKETVKEPIKEPAIESAKILLKEHVIAEIKHPKESFSEQSKEFYAVHNQLLMLKEDLVKLKQKLVCLSKKLSGINDKLSKL